MAEFCKQFNEKTKNFDKDTPVPVVLSGYYIYISINGSLVILYI